MKKKIIALAAAALLIVGLVPALSFGGTADLRSLVIDGKSLNCDASGIVSNQSGDDWTYADGTLTLNNYAGGGIYAAPAESATPQLTIVLKGANTITTDGGGVLGGSGASFVFQGGGTLDITGQTWLPAIYAQNGTVTFDLSLGGEIRLDPVKPSLQEFAEPNLPFWALDTPIAIAVFENIGDSHLMSATPDLIILKSDNVITRPEGSKTGIYTWDMALLPVEEATSPSEPAVAAPKAEESIATILDADGQFPASAATITVLPPQEEPVPEPTAPAPGSVTPVKAPKTGDNAMPGIMMVLMVAGAGTAMGLAKRKFD